MKARLFSTLLVVNFAPHLIMTQKADIFSKIEAQMAKAETDLLEIKLV